MENLKELVPDQQRLHVLLSSLPGSRMVNPAQWDSAIDFWKARIVNYCRAKKRIWFTPSEIFTHLEVGDKKPWCLPDVIAELIRSGFLCSKQTMDAKFSWRAWATKNLLWTPISYISIAKSYLPLSSNSTTIDKPSLPDAFMTQPLFIPSLLEEYSDSTMKSNNTTNMESFDCVFTAEEFTETCISNVEDSNTKRLILESWKHKGIVKYAVINGQEIYKLGESSITEHDTNILNLKTSIKSFENKISAREKQHDELMAKVKTALAVGNKTEARRILRQAKVIREEIEKFRITVDRLLDTKSTIDSAVLNAKVVGAVKGGSELLKQYASPKKVEEVREAMDDLDEQTALAQEISSAISTPMAGPSDDDMAELEAELAGLVVSAGKSGAKKAAEISNIEKLLPITPTGVPKRPMSSPREESPLVTG